VRLPVVFADGPHLADDAVVATRQPKFVGQKNFFSFFFAKPFRTQLFHGRNSEPDRGGFLFLCQKQSTDKNKFISTGCTGTPLRQMLDKRIVNWTMEKKLKM
jgi:hypothetical protein